MAYALLPVEFEEEWVDEVRDPAKRSSVPARRAITYFLLMQFELEL